MTALSIKLFNIISVLHYITLCTVWIIFYESSLKPTGDTDGSSDTIGLN